MSEKNICLFIPHYKDQYTLSTVHFVLETKKQTVASLKTESLYKMYYVRSGRGVLHTVGAAHSLGAGDVFFTFPGIPFGIESGEDFTYMYISFLGTRGNQTMERCKISPTDFLFHHCEEVGEIWEKGFAMASQMSDITSESMLLYTFSYLGSRLPALKQTARKTDTVALIKKYIDDHVSDTDFSLEAICKEISYNKKYLSSCFKKNMGIGIIDYLNTVRIQHACHAIEQGFTCVGDIAFMCGFSDPQYFSKVFKRKTGVSPSGYIKSII